MNKKVVWHWCEFLKSSSLNKKRHQNLSQIRLPECCKEKKSLHFGFIFLEIVHKFKDFIFIPFFKDFSGRHWIWNTVKWFELWGDEKTDPYSGKCVSIPMKSEAIFINEDIKIYKEVDSTLSGLALYLFTLEVYNLELCHHVLLLIQA